MKCKSIYEKISKIAKGDESLVNIELISPADIQKYNLTKYEKTNETGIPEYWLRAMENSKYFYSMNEKDKEVLKYLDDVFLEIHNNKIVYILAYFKLITNFL